VLWILYVALEPEIRARWPHSIVTWNRLLAGRWKDPQVCSHILVGSAVGIIEWLGVEWIVWGGSGLEIARGTRHWIGGYAGALAHVLIAAFALSLIVFTIKPLVKKHLLAAVLAAAIAVFFNFGDRPAQSLQHWQLIAAYFGLFAILIFVLLRLGLVAFCAAIFFANSANNIIVGAGWTTWYAPYGLATLAMLLGIALFAFWRSLGSRELLGPE